MGLALGNPDEEDDGEAEGEVDDEGQPMGYVGGADDENSGEVEQFYDENGNPIELNYEEYEAALQHLQMQNMHQQQNEEMDEHEGGHLAEEEEEEDDA